MRKFGINIKSRNPEPKEAFLLLSNHTYYYDGFFLGYSVKRPVSFLASDEICFTELVGSWVMNCVFTEKGTHDLNAIIKMKRLLERGVSVGVFPEGDRGWDGRTDILNRNLPRLIRVLNVPIRLANLKGGYLTGLRWGVPNFRHGKVDIELETLTLEQQAELDDESLYNLISEKLSNNDVKNTDLKSTPFIGDNLATGIHNLLWLCPECGSHDSIRGEGDEIVCTGCSKRWTLDDWCGISPEGSKLKDIQDWSDMQRDVLQQWWSDDSSGNLLTSSFNIGLYHYIGQGRAPRHGGRKFKLYGQGKMELYRNVWKFIPEDKDLEPIEFDTAEVKNYVEGLNVEFGFRYEGMRYKVNSPEGNLLKYFHFFRYKDGFYNSVSGISTL